MALETTKQIVLNSNSKIDDKNVVSLSATITDATAIGNITQHVQDSDAYNANRSQVRKDIAEFQAKVWEIEDEIALENATP